jgi:acyl-CoA synthetase (AMP-forming)/AMP-acid ligase II
MHWQSYVQFYERFRNYGLQAGSLATCYAMAENVFAVTQAGIDTPVTVDIVEQGPLLSEQVAVPVEYLEHTRPEGEAPAVVRMLSAGTPIAGTELRVLGPDGRDLPERRIGEIALRSNCMLTGYFHRPDLTEKAFLDGWYLTGDLGYLADGELYITGRKKDLIIVGGKNIYPQDLERLAAEAPGVHPGRVVAFGVFNEQTGTEDVVVVAESDLETETERQQVAEEIRQRVNRGSDIVLRTVRVVGRNWLQKTSSGKIARLANKEKYLREQPAEE